MTVPWGNLMHSVHRLGDAPAMVPANESTGGDVDPLTLFIAAAAVSAFLIFRVVLGVLAYTGRWRRWQRRHFATNNTAYAPFYYMWLSVAGLCILLPLTVSSGLELLGVIDDWTAMPSWLVLPLGCIALPAILAAALYAIYPPKWVLPRYVREAEGRDRPRGNRNDQENEQPESSQ
ncbi:hypothetical protein [Thermomonospora catenispora]|uniref:hypothetical protein n=1 Tax=Thermomonospora catenispora TaxID=2493090 RepID=UPI0011224166|nr:hypothetical protein [Thermomonospora catenispora]TNY36651.1 hypothetical protein EIO00_12765 [Thermomonospora catenispora]